ncbi:acyl-CoA dehydrogenase family protein [Cryptosporangium sp. NPDC048952]|uniref:acyl-CoA dehydrogenase family protein n=1 Tax=Cryptosporangium sp. NPDC048952 TaxID=3363961 RepID=UPI003713B881
MRVELSDEAVSFGREVSRAIEAAGGDSLLQLAELDPEGRADLAEPVLKELGAWELEPRRDPDELEAAAALCRSVGYWALPYPVAERLARPVDLDVDGLLVVAPDAPRAAVAGLDLRWAAVTLDGSRSVAVPMASDVPPRHAAFVAPLLLRPLYGMPTAEVGSTASARSAAGAGPSDAALALVLPVWTLLGMLDRALALAVGHVTVREQFGRPLSALQGVQFQLTDAEVERAGLDALAGHALWSAGVGGPDALVDAIALRVAAIEAAEVVFRVAHQVHGAMGFCDETPVSWLSRYSQPLRRLPWGLSASRDLLVRAAGRRGLTGLFAPSPAAATPASGPAVDGLDADGTEVGG